MIDLFQSYSHFDRKPSEWAKNFHDELKTRIAGITMPRIDLKTFFDDRDRDINNLPKNIESALDESGILLVVFSPGYLQSEWCRLERSYFLSKNNKDRIYKVVKYYNDNILTPDELITQYEYKFYKLINGDPIELDSEDREFRLEINRLAHDLVDYIKSYGGVPEVDTGIKNTLFLAETISESWAHRVSLINELKVHNINVLPNEVLSNQELLRSMEIKQLLNQSSISVHLIGPNAGQIEEDQLNAAQEATKTRPFDVKIWISRDASGSGLAKKILSDDFANDSFDIVIGSFERFKGNVLNYFNK